MPHLNVTVTNEITLNDFQLNNARTHIVLCGNQIYYSATAS